MSRHQLPPPTSCTGVAYSRTVRVEGRRCWVIRAHAIIEASREFIVIKANIYDQSKPMVLTMNTIHICSDVADADHRPTTRLTPPISATETLADLSLIHYSLRVSSSPSQICSISMEKVTIFSHLCPRKTLCKLPCSTSF